MCKPLTKRAPTAATTPRGGEGVRAAGTWHCPRVGQAGAQPPGGAPYSGIGWQWRRSGGGGSGDDVVLWRCGAVGQEACDKGGEAGGLSIGQPREDGKHLPWPPSRLLGPRAPLPRSMQHRQPGKLTAGQCVPWMHRATLAYARACPYSATRGPYGAPRVSWAHGSRHGSTVHRARAPALFTAAANGHALARPWRGLPLQQAHGGHLDGATQSSTPRDTRRNRPFLNHVTHGMHCALLNLTMLIALAICAALMRPLSLGSSLGCTPGGQARV